MLGFFDVEQLNDNAVRLTFLGWGTRSATSASPGCGRTRPCTNLFMRVAPSWFPTTKNICAWKSIPACMLLFCNFLCGVLRICLTHRRVQTVYPIFCTLNPIAGQQTKPLNNSPHSPCPLPLWFFSHHALPAVIAFLHWRKPHIQTPARGQKGCTTSS